MSRHPDFPATPEALFEAAGRAAGRVLAARQPRTGASRLSYREIAAMAALIGEIGLAVAPETPASKPASKTPETIDEGAL